MTFNGWKTVYSHKLDLMCNSELQQLPEWNEWSKRIDEVLNEMAYEDAIGCELEDLISRAGLTGEVEAALNKLSKEHYTNRRIEKLKSDF